VETNYLQKFTASFLVVVAPLHAIKTSGKSFQWGKNQQKDFNEIKRKINQALVLASPKFQNPFKVKINASVYAMGAVLMQGGRPLCYHYEILHGEVLNYRTYDKELCYEHKYTYKIDINNIIIK
jgi:hypothetical protein